MVAKLTQDFLEYWHGLPKAEAAEALERLVRAAYGRGVKEGLERAEVAATSFGIEWCQEGERCTRHKDTSNLPRPHYHCSSPYCTSAWCIADRIRLEAEDDEAGS